MVEPRLWGNPRMDSTESSYARPLRLSLRLLARAAPRSDSPAIHAPVPAGPSSIRQPHPPEEPFPPLVPPVPLPPVPVPELPPSPPLPPTLKPPVPLIGLQDEGSATQGSTHCPPTQTSGLTQSSTEQLSTQAPPAQVCPSTQPA